MKRTIIRDWYRQQIWMTDYSKINFYELLFENNNNFNLSYLLPCSRDAPADGTDSRDTLAGRCRVQRSGECVERCLPSETSGCHFSAIVSQLLENLQNKYIFF